MSEPTFPAAAHAALVSRTTEGPVGHEWTGNDDDAGQHHGLLDANDVPCLLALYWQSRRAGRTVHVGTYKLRLRQLARAGYAQEKPGNKVRLRFVRNHDGVIEIRPNDSTPGLPVGRADF
ncbi:MAG: hypothetical protein WD851_13005 [Pirellulales bacterium]